MENSSSTNKSFPFHQLTYWSRSHDVTISTLVLFRSTFVLVFVFAPLVLVKLKGYTRNENPNQAPLPSGPTPWPIIANLPELWKNKPAFRWILGLMKQLDNDIACIRLGNIHVIAVTSPQIAVEFLKKNDSIFASRPITMAADTVSDISDASVIINLRLVVRQYTGNVFRRMMFDKRYFGKGKHDGGPGHEEVEHVESLFTVLMHINSFILSDYVPWLRPFDLEGHEKIVREAMRIVNGYHDPIIDERVQQWRQGKREEPADLLDAFILAKDSNGKPALSVEEIKAQCTDLILAAIDNPANAAEWGMAEMLNKPEILQKACQELDNVVGKDRLGSLSASPHCTLQHPPCLKEDATVAGYFIPKGSHVLVSRAGINPIVWDEPLEFKPERHLKGVKVDLTEPELRFVSFGTGRRGCMGVALGSEMTIMLFARLIQGFTWSIQPNEEKIDLSESEHALFLAKPLHALVKPRLPTALYDLQLD
ncbi:hypothetical protein PTKIN_Ptkin16aG0015200 [Pterospermum kingtungense]